MIRLLKALAAVLLLGVASGCATQSVGDAAVAARPEPTHRWIADMDVSRAKYNFDNNACVLETSDSSAESSDSHVEARLEDRSLRRDEPAFVAYERCMEGKGYNLATY